MSCGWARGGRVFESGNEKKPFYEATWAKVRVGDVVLLPRLSLNRIVKAEIRQCTFEPGRVIVVFNCGALWGETFGPEETVYVQSRL